MELDALRTNQLTADGWAWYQDYLEALDAYDVDRYVAFLADDVEIRFGDAEPIVGRDAARAGLAGFWGSVAAMGFTLVHAPLNISGTDDRFVMEALNHYDRPDGRRITVRAVAFTDRDASGRVVSVRVHQDLSAVFTA